MERHPRESGDLINLAPNSLKEVPAFAGMTVRLINAGKAKGSPALAIVCRLLYGACEFTKFRNKCLQIINTDLAEQGFW